MRSFANGGMRKLRHGTLALALLALGAGRASAQMVFDGKHRLPEQRHRDARRTVRRRRGRGRSRVRRGLHGGAARHGHLHAQHLRRPAAPQRALQTEHRSQLPALAGQRGLHERGDGSERRLFEQVCYKGAIGPNAGDDWTQGWTYYDSTGANRQDLHLVGMPSRVRSRLQQRAPLR
jgi:hypothetical protein